MTKTRLILLSTLGVMLMLAAACSSALPGGGDDGDNASTLSIGAQREGEQQSLSQGDAAFEGAGDVTSDNYSEYAVNAAGGAEEPAAPADQQLGNALDRKIIQSSSIDLGVEGENGVSRSFQDIIRIAETAGGFVANSSFSNIDEKQFADVTIRVPSTQYQSVLAEIRGMGTVSEESSDANDVTEEFTDLQARLRTLNATEQRYLELLGRAETINDILVVQDRLDFVRGQIEQVVGRINLLDNLTDLATITVHLSPAAPAVVPSSDGGSLTPSEAFGNAWQASLTVLGGIAIAGLVVVAFSWWLVPPLVALAIGTRWWMNRTPRAAVRTPVS